MQSFFNRLAKVKWQLKGVTDSTINNAARCGLREGSMAERMAWKPILHGGEIFDKMEEYACAEEDSMRRVDKTSTAAAGKVGTSTKSDRTDNHQIRRWAPP